MDRPQTFSFSLIVTEIVVLVFSLFLLFPSFAYGGDPDDPENIINEAASFEELTAWMDENASTGGTISLTKDITVPAGASYTYVNGRYQKEITILTMGNTIYVEGYLELWPFLTVQGDHQQQEMFHILPGGELWLVGISIDAGEGNAAIVQEEGSFLVYGDTGIPDMPAFSCVGSIICPETVTAAAYWKYDYETIPVVKIPAGADFSEAMLPDTVFAYVNRGQSQTEETIPVVWEEETFPTEKKRTLVQGYFSEGYAPYKDYAPKCLIVWESDTAPYFTNAYKESLSQWYTDIYLYAETPLEGEIRIEVSDDGESWTEIQGIDGYELVNGALGEPLSWRLCYPMDDPAVSIPKYFSMSLTLSDGTIVYSDILQLGDESIFTGSDIEGGRGGETSPGEGEDQLPSFGNGAPDEEPDEDTDDESWWPWPDYGYQEILPTKPGSTEPGSTEPGPTGPDSTEPGPTGPDSTELESSEPGSTEPGSTEPGSTGPESTEPESSEPESSEPGSSTNSSSNEADRVPSDTVSDPSVESEPSKPADRETESSSFNKEEPFKDASDTSFSDSSDTVTADASRQPENSEKDSFAAVSSSFQLLLGTGIIFLIVGGSVAFAVVRKKR